MAIRYPHGYVPISTWSLTIETLFEWYMYQYEWNQIYGYHATIDSILNVQQLCSESFDLVQNFFYTVECLSYAI